jgi:hypothetical protein
MQEERGGGCLRGNGVSCDGKLTIAAGDRVDYPSQHTRFILFFPVGETDKTISTLLPQMLQRCILLFASVRAPTSVFDFPFSAISIPPFFFQFIRLKVIPLVHSSGTHFPLSVIS